MFNSAPLPPPDHPQGTPWHQANVTSPLPSPCQDKSLKLPSWPVSHIRLPQGWGIQSCKPPLSQTGLSVPAASFGYWIPSHRAESNEGLIRRYALPSAPAGTWTEAAEHSRDDEGYKSLYKRLHLDKVVFLPARITNIPAAFVLLSVFFF